MHHADKVATVYHKEWDKERGVDSYRGTVLKDVSFFPESQHRFPQRV